MAHFPGVRKIGTDLGESTYLVSFAVLALSLAVYKVIFRRPRNVLALPPGPPKKFIIGNYDILPMQHPWITYSAWAKEYGPIFHLRVFSQDMVILNKPEHVLTLLESRAIIYSDRPVSIMMRKIAQRDGSVFTMPYDDPRFRKQRKLMHTGLSPRAVLSYRAIQTQEVNTLLKGLSETPGEYIKHLRRNAAALILRVTYGYQVSEDNDVFIKNIEKAFAYSLRKLNQPFAVDFFPFLRFLPSWLPFVKFKRVAKELDALAVETPPFEWAKKIIESGHHIESFTSRLLYPEEGPRPDAEEEDIIKWCCAALYVGGADTTVSAVTSFFRLMTLHPSIQARAQADIDSVTGKERLPTLDDQKSLPYIMAIIREVVRRAPVVPLGLRHRVMEEDVYKGYRIPKGSIVVANIWEVVHDPDLYPSPEVFNPDRHLGDNPQTDPFKFIFGFGRRVCPGAHLAEQSLFLTVSNIFAVFDLQSPEGATKDGGGESAIEFTGGPINHMKPFPCRITPRVPHLLPS